MIDANFSSSYLNTTSGATLIGNNSTSNSSYVFEGIIRKMHIYDQEVKSFKDVYEPVPYWSYDFNSNVFEGVTGLLPIYEYDHYIS